jgi:hypothetical protein
MRSPLIRHHEICRRRANRFPDVEAVVPRAHGICDRDEGVLHRVTGPLQRYRAASDWPAKVVALHQGATRVPQKKFSSQNHDLAFAAHVSD